MHRPRVIPVLLLRGSGLVKTHKFANPSYVGDPINAVRIFNEKEVDELIILDINASKEKRGPNLDLIAGLAEECFMPLCYGGGITSTEQMRQLFYLGIEKVALNSAIIDDVSLVRDAADMFGSQSVIASIDLKKGLIGDHAIFSHSGRKAPRMKAEDYAKMLADHGAGEILVHAVNHDGVRQGFDMALCERIARAVQIPVIACGGGGTLEHFRDVIKDAGVAAAAGGSFFVHQGKHRAVLITYPKAEKIEHLLA